MGNFTKVQLSISKKNKETGNYETDFSGFVNFVGHAHNKAAKINEGDRVKIGNCDVTTKYNKDKKITYTNYAVFDFEPVNSVASAPQEDSGEYTENDGGDLPY